MLGGRLMDKEALLPVRGRCCCRAEERGLGSLHKFVRVVVVQTCSYSSQDVDAGGSQTRDQLELQSGIQSENS